MLYSGKSTTACSSSWVSMLKSGRDGHTLKSHSGHIHFLIACNYKYAIKTITLNTLYLGKTSYLNTDSAYVKLVR